MEKDGADIIDFGAQSTRPGYTPIFPEEEWMRLEPVLKAVKDKISVPISVDTYYPYVAEKALASGADIINDVSGVVSSAMSQIIKKWQAGWIITHNGEGDVEDVAKFFKRAAYDAILFGIKIEQICFDMGIGFGKTREQDMNLIANIPSYRLPNFPILLGTSRKRVIKEGSGQKNPKKRIYGNIAADTVAILGGADIIRLHDVAKEKQGIYMADALKAHYKESQCEDKK